MAKKKALVAKDVAANPTLVDAQPGLHLLLYDKSSSSSFVNMLAALDQLAVRGWRVVSMSTNLSTSMAQVEMYALLQREPNAGGDGVAWPYEV